MLKEQKNTLKYLPINTTDEDWGIVCTTTGYQNVPPMSCYPVSKHPEKYSGVSESNRVLNEYQLVYIVDGEGYFSSRSCKKTKISAGTMILLFPGEWHTYQPLKETGWKEYWVGFKGVNIDKRVNFGFFSRLEPIHKIGISASIVGFYQEIIKLTEDKKTGYQQFITGIVLHILGSVYYKNLNNQYKNNPIVNKINEARILMQENIGNTITPEEIASTLGIGYSWFRRTFKEYVGISPVQYQLQLKLIKAKELLTGSTLSISEIAYTLGFENPCLFSRFFRCKEGISASDFRDRTH